MLAHWACAGQFVAYFAALSLFSTRTAYWQHVAATCCASVDWLTLFLFVCMYIPFCVHQGQGTRTYLCLTCGNTYFCSSLVFYSGLAVESYLRNWYGKCGRHSRCAFESTKYWQKPAVINKNLNSHDVWCVLRELGIEEQIVKYIEF